MLAAANEIGWGREQEGRGKVQLLLFISELPDALEPFLLPEGLLLIGGCCGVVSSM